MARTPDLPCARCGTLLWRGSTSLPEGRAVCRACRRERSQPYGPRPGCEISYIGAHIRVRNQRGPASSHRCRHCGGQAKHWAYDHDDQAEKRDSRFGPYSGDPAHYVPLCVSCHKKFDLAHLREAA